MKRVILLRHAECSGDGFCGGGNDPDLTEEGKTQAQSISAALEVIRPGFIFCSPMKRCRQTIAPYLRKYPAQNLIVHDSLREVDFGDWEGATAENVQKRDPQGLNSWFRNPIDESPPGGENLLELHERVIAYWKKVVMAECSDTVLVVSHGGPIRAILSEIAGAGPEGHWRFLVERGSFCCLSIFDDGISVIESTNFTSECISSFFQTRSKQNGRHT